MSKEDHPAFFGKDFSNLPKEQKQPTLFEIMREAEAIMSLTAKEIEQLEYDIKFLEIITRWKNG